jgi:hypothetical protein
VDIVQSFLELRTDDQPPADDPLKTVILAAFHVAGEDGLTAPELAELLLGRELTAKAQIHSAQNIPDDEWDAAAKIVIAQIRAETGIPNWLPSYLNGRREFRARTLDLISKQRRKRTAHSGT